jgi:hypothetical protein
MAKTVAYRMRRDDKGRLRRVYPFNGVDCYMDSYTSHCSGCTEVPEMTTAPEAGGGCHECGYQGKRRESIHVPFCRHEACAMAIYGGGPAVQCAV